MFPFLRGAGGKLRETIQNLFQTPFRGNPDGVFIYQRKGVWSEGQLSGWPLLRLWWAEHGGGTPGLQRRQGSAHSLQGFPRSEQGGRSNALCAADRHFHLPDGGRTSACQSGGKKPGCDPFCESHRRYRCGVCLWRQPGVLEDLPHRNSISAVCQCNEMRGTGRWGRRKRS